MSYSPVVTTTNLLGGRWLIRVEETQAANGSGVDILLSDPNGDGLQPPIPFTKFRLLQAETYKVSGAAATVQPMLQRYLADGSSKRIVFMDDTPTTAGLYTFAYPPLVYATKLRHSPQPASASDAVVWTEYLIERAD